MNEGVLLIVGRPRTGVETFGAAPNPGMEFWRKLIKQAKAHQIFVAPAIHVPGVSCGCGWGTASWRCPLHERLKVYFLRLFTEIERVISV